MSAGKLSRSTGLVFVLAAFLGGAGLAGVEHETGGPITWAHGIALDMAAVVAGGITYLPADFDWG